MGTSCMLCCTIACEDDVFPYLLVLVGGDCGEHRLGEGEGPRALAQRHGPHRGQLLSALLADHVHARLVFMHGVQYNLKGGKKRLVLAMPCAEEQVIFRYYSHLMGMLGAI